MIRRLLLALIRFYRRFLSPMHAPCCPFTPTCSTYAMQAIERHGAIYGSYLAIRRLLRCQPLYKGSFYDPVPRNETENRKQLTKKSFIPRRERPFIPARRPRTILDARRTFRP
ncbi:MAG: membrane protein insertion efficiency factor YidD [Christensenellales bacterium]